jgi:hypothetical protein
MIFAALPTYTIGTGQTAGAAVAGGLLKGAFGTGHDGKSFCYAKGGGMVQA